MLFHTTQTQTPSEFAYKTTLSVRPKLDIKIQLAEQGVPINVIQEILAHSDVRTTMKYVHLVEDSKRKALESIL